MPLAPGTQLGPYEILSQLGAGGMGEVYRARDSRLGRDVAIKVSAEKFNERFEREAKVVASLNHPNICALYDVGPNYIVMELIEGEEPKGPMPLDEALQICRQIAAALEAAHEKGIVHRDLKPANIKVTPNGTVKVLDFGLAKINSLTPASGNPEESPTISMKATQVGMILGTAGYMAPEQAKGKPADKRADIWAFGVVLHELLTGQRLFLGETVTDTLAAVVLSEPKLADAPSQVRRLLKRCLEKDPQKRLRDIGDAMALLEEAPAPSSASLIAAPPPRSLLARLVWPVAFGIALLAAAAITFIHFHETPPVAETVRFTAAIPENVNFTIVGMFTLSPDGRKLAFSAAGVDGVPRIWIRSLESLTAQPLPGSETGPSLAALVWSPDSRFIAYQADGKLKKIDTAGGPPVALCDASEQVVGGSWNRDGVIVFRKDGALMRVSAAGGTPSAVIPAVAGSSYAFPEFLPDGRHFLYLQGARKPDDTGFYVGSIDVKPEQQNKQRLMDAGFQPLYVPSADSKSGHIIVLRDGTLLAQPFDAGRLQLAGEAIPIAEQVSSIQGLGYFSASDNGALAYRTGAMRGAGLSLQLSWFDRAGKSTLTAVEGSRSSTVKVSPDGKRAAVVRSDPQSNNYDIWIVDLATGGSNRLTFDPAVDGNALWSPDGSQIIWQSQRGGSWGIYRKASNGSGNEELLYKSSAKGTFALTDWTRDGRFVLFQASDPPAKTDIFALPVGPGSSADRQAIPVIQTPAGELGGYVSPDGKWIAYISDESGRQEIYVQAFNPNLNQGSKSGSSPVSGKWMVSKGSLGMARWRSDGKELVFIGADGAMMSVDVTSGVAFQASQPKQLFQLPSNVLAIGGSTPGARMDATRDLQRFLVTIPAQNNSRQEFTVVLNWQSALKR
jgi:Tol biopolymer transport system component/predicted Ser/Thr protein kinase